MKCAHCGSYDTQTLLDLHRCLTCGGYTKAGTGEPERSGDDKLNQAAYD